jgi:hypothetical protein
MAITRDDLKAYKAEREEELKKLEVTKSKKVEEINQQVEAYKKSLVDEYAREYALDEAEIRAEIRLIDNLIAKDQNPEEELT